MSIILMVGKTCLACSACEDEAMKREFQSHLFIQTSDALAEFAMLSDYELITYDEFVNFCSSVTMLRLLCFKCNGRDQFVFQEIQLEIIPAIEKEVNANALLRGRKKCPASTDGVIRFDFVNKKWIGR